MVTSSVTLKAYSQLPSICMISTDPSIATPSGLMTVGELGVIFLCSSTGVKWGDPICYTFQIVRH